MLTDYYVLGTLTTKELLNNKQEILSLEGETYKTLKYFTVCGSEKRLYFSVYFQEMRTSDQRHKKHLIQRDALHSLKLLSNTVGCLVRFGFYLFLIKQAGFFYGVDVNLMWEMLLEFLKRQSLVSLSRFHSYIIPRRHVGKYIAWTLSFI